MATTRGEFLTRYRRQLGETTAGFHTDAELVDDISIAQRELVSDTITHDGFSLITRTERHHVREGQRVFTVPKEAIEVISVEYLDGTTWEPLTQHTEEALEEWRGDTYTNTPLHFAVRRAREIITEGIATSGSDTTITDLDRTGISDFLTGSEVTDSQGNQLGTLSTQEWVENMSDKSLARVLTTTSGTTLTFAAGGLSQGIQGGSRNNYEKGDHYRVLADSHNRMEVVLRNGAGTASFSTAVEHSIATDSGGRAIGNNAGTESKQAMSFLLTRAGAVAGVSIRLGGSTGTPLGALSARIDTDNSSVPSDTLIGSGANLAKGSRETSVASTWNDVWFLHPAYLAANTLSWLVAEIPTQGNYYASPSENHLLWAQDTDAGYANGNQASYTGSWASGTNDFQFKIYIADEGGPLRVRYAAMPKELGNANDVLEIPIYAEQALMHLCMQKGLAKRPGSEGLQQYHMNLFEVQMDKIRKQVRSRSRSGYHVIRDETPGILPYRIRRSRPSGAVRLSYE